MHTIVVTVVDKYVPNSLTVTLVITGGGAVSSGSIEMFPL